MFDPEEYDWTFSDFRPQLDSLNPEVKEKAKEIAEKLLKKNEYSEEEAIQQAIKQAEEWFYDLEG